MENNENTEHIQVQALDLDAILAEYQRRKTVESLIGPGVSLVIHIMVLTATLLFYHPQAPMTKASIELEMKELEIKELDKKDLEELEKLEEVAEEVVPTVERPTLVTDTDAAADVANAVEDFSDKIASTDDSANFSDVLDIRANDSPLKISSLYGGRSNEGRQAQLKRFGGSDATENAVLRALRWLKATQNNDGSWGTQYKSAMAGLGLLSFLAHGETPASDEFGQTVQKAMQYLIADTDRLPNTVDGKTKVNPYTNGIVAYALSEAYGLTSLPTLKPAMEKCLRLLVEGQQKAGGYDYSYACGERWDLSVAGWQMQAMKAGFVAGADVKDLQRAIERGVSFIKNVAYSKTNLAFPMGYASPGGGSWGMQGAGTLCLQLLGEGNSREVKAVSKLIVDNHLPVVKWVNPDMSVSGMHSNMMYHWYYETQVMFHTGSTSWKKWNGKFAPLLIQNQHKDGYWEAPPMTKPPKDGKICNFGPDDKWYTTTLSCLSLQVYYRYLPSYKMPKNIAKQEKSSIESLDDELGLSL